MVVGFDKPRIDALLGLHARSAREAAMEGMTMNLHPLNGHVLLRLVDAEERTRGGIYVPDAARERPADGVIEALPAGGSDELEIGDRVLYKKHAGEEIALDGVKRRLVPEGELLAKIVQAEDIPA